MPFSNLLGGVHSPVAFVQTGQSVVTHHLPCVAKSSDLSGPAAAKRIIRKGEGLMNPQCALAFSKMGR